MTAAHDAPRPVVALLPGYPTIEDYLGPLSLTLDDFAERMDGGWLFGYVAALATAGVDSVVVCFSAAATKPVRREHRPTGGRILVVPAPRRVHALRALERRGPRLARAGARHATHLTATPVGTTASALADERCAALVCQEYEYPRFEASLAIGRRLGAPVFATFQGASQALSPLERPLRRRSVRAAAGLIVAARDERERLQGRYGVATHRIAAIFNPLDTTRWHAGDRGAARAALGIPENARVVAWHGRVEMRKKGLDLLLDAWRLVAERAPDAILLLLGSGADAPALRARLDRDEIPGVRWRDEYVLDDEVIRRHLDAADVFAFASREEGLPVAVLEAMACGLPVVATDAPGVDDILEGEEAAGGVLVAPEGETLALALLALLDDPERAADLGRRARRRVEDAFALEPVGAALARFLLPDSHPGR